MMLRKITRVICYVVLLGALAGDACGADGGVAAVLVRARARALARGAVQLAAKCSSTGAARLPDR
jgi:hypothetical protein